MAFTHLHLHTEYSLLDGAARIKKVVARAKELGMTSVAITDHGVMFGVIDFYKECKKEGIKPIIGCEVYTAARKMTDKEGDKDKHSGHLILLAKDQVGYKNLIKIVSLGFTKGLYYRPRIDKDVLREHSKGIIALSACLSGNIQKQLLFGNYAEAKKEAEALLEIFGKGNFYLEVQDHGLEDEYKIFDGLIRLSKELDVPLVATNDVHYVRQEDSVPHDVLLAIQTGTTIDDENRMRYPNDQFYFKSEDEMRKIFARVPEACDNTQIIADMCNVDFTFGQYHLPEYKAPDGKSNNQYLRELCYKGLKERYGENPPKSNVDRLEYELGVIESMGYVEYFLIVWDFINYAKTNGIMVGPGRGSGAGSIVAYCLRITDIDPIKYNLIFERFLNPERVSMPDLDIDFCYERRQEVIDYVSRKYGEGRVSQIITFGTMKAKQAVRDVGRVLNVSYAKTDVIAKAIPLDLGMTIDKALEVSPDLIEMYSTDEETQKVIDMAHALEGMPRHASTHAAGVVISKEPVDEYVPLYVASDKGSPATQFTMTTIEELGLLKMDFLGLRNLTVIRDAISLIESNHGIKIDFSDMPYDDPKIYEMISSGNTEGIFQLESGGMTQFMKNLKPNCFEDIVAGVSLYRPGPMDSIPKYIENKKHPEQIEYVHPALEPILGVTYGCLVYQEQVMQIVRDLGGYSYGRSDLVRRAMSKKKMSVMLEEKEYFINGKLDDEGNVEIPGCVRNGVPKEAAEFIFNDMVSFAQYAFNKSHAAAYSVISYETAYLKTYYPVEFMAALMTSVMGDSKAIAKYIRNCEDMGIEILPPSVNYSQKKFSVEDGNIRFGLLGVKNVGEGIIDSIVKAREEKGLPKDIYTFANNIDPSEIKKNAIESLIKAGAMDCFSTNRAALMSVYEAVVDSAQSSAKRNVAGQMSLFDTESEVMEAGTMGNDLPNVKNFDKRIQLEMEKEMLGVYLTDHPLNEYREMMESIVTVTADKISGLEDEETMGVMSNRGISDGATCIMAGMVATKKTLITKSGKMMAFVNLEDLYGVTEIVVFPNTYEASAALLGDGSVIAVRGTLNCKENETPKILANEILSVEDAVSKGFSKKTYAGSGGQSPAISYEERERNYRQVAREPQGTVKLRIPSNMNEKSTLEQIELNLKRHRGDCRVLIYLASGKTLKTNESLWVKPSSELRNMLIAILGQENVKM